MAETLPELISGLAAAASRPGVTDVDLLSAQLSRLRFVHLRRRDVVAQAVSWAKSLQTHFWHPGEAVAPGGQDPHYDEELIGRLVATIERSEADWTVWFAAHSIVPCEVTYEELAADPPRTAQRCSTISVLMFRRIGNWWSGTVDRPINSTQTGSQDLSLTEPSVLPERLPTSRPSCDTRSVWSFVGAAPSHPGTSRDRLPPSSTALLGQGGQAPAGSPPETGRVSRTRSRSWSSTPGYRQFP